VTVLEECEGTLWECKYFATEFRAKGQVPYKMLFSQLIEAVAYLHRHVSHPHSGLDTAVRCLVFHCMYRQHDTCYMQPTIGVFTAF
jgi:hypothetical protein